MDVECALARLRFAIRGSRPPTQFNLPKYRFIISVNFSPYVHFRLIDNGQFDHAPHSVFSNYVINCRFAT